MPYPGWWSVMRRVGRVIQRLLDLDRAGLVALRGRALDDAVRAAEGRTLVSEVFAAAPGLVDGVHNAELMAAHGADLIILNLVEGAWDGRGAWRLPWLGDLADLRELATMVGRPIGVNLEPGEVPTPRRAVPETARALIDAGAAMLCLTANPGTGSSYADLARATAGLREALGDEAALWVGKMHHAGHPERLSPRAELGLVDAGASGVLVPLPGTVPGITRAAAAEAAAAAQERGAIVLGTIGTSQEGAPVAVATALALVAKEIGVDAHHIGDAGFLGTGDPDLLHAYSLAVRGRRHTWRRMALGARPARG